MCCGDGLLGDCTGGLERRLRFIPPPSTFTAMDQHGQGVLVH